jgi:hypothetical protein
LLIRQRLVIVELKKLGVDLRPAVAEFGLFGLLLFQLLGFLLFYHLNFEFVLSQFVNSILDTNLILVFKVIAWAKSLVLTQLLLGVRESLRMRNLLSVFIEPHLLRVHLHVLLVSSPTVTGLTRHIHRIKRGPAGFLKL